MLYNIELFFYYKYTNVILQLKAKKHQYLEVYFHRTWDFPTPHHYVWVM